MDAITLLKNEHKAVETLFKRFEKTGPSAHKTRAQVVDQIIEALSKHAAIEEQVFYPAVRAALPDEEDTVLEALEEHHVVKWTLAELESMAPDDERFAAKVTVLMESVRHHVGEEEQELFPAVRQALGRTQLGELGEAMEAARRLAPARPHPRAPDTPPGNLVAGLAAGAIDTVAKAGRRLVGRK